MTRHGFLIILGLNSSTSSMRCRTKKWGPKLQGIRGAPASPSVGDSSYSPHLGDHGAVNPGWMSFPFTAVEKRGVPWKISIRWNDYWRRNPYFINRGLWIRGWHYIILLYPTVDLGIYGSFFGPTCSSRGQQRLWHMRGYLNIGYRQLRCLITMFLVEMMHNFYFCCLGGFPWYTGIPNFQTHPHWTMDRWGWLRAVFYTEECVTLLVVVSHRISILSPWAFMGQHF